ncbi:MAG: hypothetical protein ABIJ34_05650 [archaeon]
MAELNYIEVKAKCVECEQLVSVVVIEGTDMSEYLCPKCSSPDGLEDEDSD